MLRLANNQWERIREHFPEEHIPDSRPGRKPVPTRAVLEAVLWILNTVARWSLLPRAIPTTRRWIAGSNSRGSLFPPRPCLRGGLLASLLLFAVKPAILARRRQV